MARKRSFHIPCCSFAKWMQRVNISKSVPLKWALSRQLCQLVNWWFIESVRVSCYVGCCQNKSYRVYSPYFFLDILKQILLDCKVFVRERVFLLRCGTRYVFDRHQSVKNSPVCRRIVVVFVFNQKKYHTTNERVISVFKSAERAATAALSYPQSGPFTKD